MFMDSAGGHIPSTDPMLCPNDHRRKCDVIYSNASESFPKSSPLVRTADGGQRNIVRSRLKCDLAPSSKLRY